MNPFSNGPKWESLEGLRLAVLGWEEGLAGQVSTWVESDLGGVIRVFVHPEDQFPTIDPASALSRPAKRFSFPTEGEYLGRPLYVGTDWTQQLEKFGCDAALVCLSDPVKRGKAYEDGIRARIEFPVVAHPSAQVLSEAEIGPGCIIEPNCYVGYRSELGSCVQMHAGSQVDHHSVVGSNCSLYPASVVAGNTYIGENSRIGMGALIANRIILGSETTVGAGSTVLKSFPDGKRRLIGTPAR